MYTVIGIILLVAVGATVGAWVRGAVRSRSLAVVSKKNLLYLIPSFAINYALYVVASVYQGADVEFFYLFNLIKKSMGMMSFDAARDIIYPIAADKWLYMVDFVLAALLSSATVVLSVVSFFGKWIMNGRRIKRVLRSSGDIVVGYSETAVKYLTVNKNAILWDEHVPAKEFNELVRLGVGVLRMPFTERTAREKLVSSEHHLLVFRDSGVSYGETIRRFNEIKPEGDGMLYLHLESTVEEMSVIKNSISLNTDGNANSFVSCFNRYELLARRFVLDYPITKFLPESFFNANRTIKHDKNVNVVFVGFGRVGYELFKLMAMQFQLAEETADGLKSKSVRYFVYDRDEDKLNNECFSKLLYEFDESFAADKRSYAKPEPICELRTVREDINSIEARKGLKSLVDDNSYTYFIISLSDDFADASYAQTIKRTFPDCDNFKIFVRAKNNRLADIARTDESVIYFGGRDEMLSHESIVNDDLMVFAREVNAFYNNLSTDKRALVSGWESLPLVEQYSNMYSALNLRYKLNLLGLDMTKNPEESDTEVSYEGYLERYDNPYAGKGITQPDFFFEKRTSNTLAFIEHQRWNAYYILCDYKPMKKEEFFTVRRIKDGTPTEVLQHKDAARKKHACLTTYYGLSELMADKYRIQHGTENVDKEKAFAEFDLYGYDYMVLDKAYKALEKMGYTVVELKK